MLAQALDLGKWANYSLVNFVKGYFKKSRRPYYWGCSWSNQESYACNSCCQGTSASLISPCIKGGAEITFMFASNKCWVRARALSLDHCLKRETGNGRGAAEGKYFFGTWFLLFCWYLFNKSQWRAAKRPIVEEQTVLLYSWAWVSMWSVYIQYIVTGHFICPLCGAEFSVSLSFPWT